jgi:carbohydrate-selective porin OprB
MLSQVSGPAPGDEHLLEAFWLVPLTAQLQLQPVIQKIDHKADDRSNSTVATLRLLLQF